MTVKLTIFLFFTTFLLIGCNHENIEQALDRTTIKSPPVNSVNIEKKDGIVTSPSGYLGEDLVSLTEEKKVETVATTDFLDNNVAFISQAPYAVWDELHQETCEEASMVNVVKYFQGEELNAHIMEHELLNLVEWQEKNGYQVDLTAAETVDILANYYNFDSELITEVTVKRIKQELAEGKLIIIPAAGRELQNPYFKTPGPIYHMLVIRGYDEPNQEFITNDVGTRRGEAFRYNYQVLIEAIHDWDHDLAQDGMTDAEMVSGRKVMIAVTK